MTDFFIPTNATFWTRANVEEDEMSAFAIPSMDQALRYVFALQNYRKIISHENCNIATMTVNRKGKSESARLVFELDSPIREDSLRYLRSLYWVKAVTYITPLD